MEDGYWDLFWNTGLPEAYLLRKRKDREQTGPAAVGPAAYIERRVWLENGPL